MSYKDTYKDTYIYPQSNQRWVTNTKEKIVSNQRWVTKTQSNQRWVTKTKEKIVSNQRWVTKTKEKIIINDFMKLYLEGFKPLSSLIFWRLKKRLHNQWFSEVIFRGFQTTFFTDFLKLYRGFQTIFFNVFWNYTTLFVSNHSQMWDYTPPLVSNHSHMSEKV